MHLHTYDYIHRIAYVCGDVAALALMAVLRSEQIIINYCSSMICVAMVRSRVTAKILRVVGAWGLGQKGRAVPLVG